jgi:hypothetical protein
LIDFIGTTKVVPCYKAMLMGVFQQAALVLSFVENHMSQKRDMGHPHPAVEFVVDASILPDSCIIARNVWAIIFEVNLAVENQRSPANLKPCLPILANGKVRPRPLM